MSDAVLDRILNQRLSGGSQAGPGAAGPSESVGGSDAEQPEDLGAFGWLRGTKERSIMLELRRKTGLILAVGYAWIEFVEFEPSEGITLWIPGRKVKLTGRGLNAELRPHVRLFEGLTRHRVPWIQERGLAADVEPAASVTVVARIEW